MSRRISACLRVIAHHLVGISQELVGDPKKKGKKKKEDEWQLEYFILLSSKHLVHFKPNTGFVDPFKKTINGKSIDLMTATVQMSNEPGPDAIERKKDEGGDVANVFEIRTKRHLYLLQPREDANSANAWVDKITEVMLDTSQVRRHPTGSRCRNVPLTALFPRGRPMRMGSPPRLTETTAISSPDTTTCSRPHRRTAAR